MRLTQEQRDARAKRYAKTPLAALRTLQEYQSVRIGSVVQANIREEAQEDLALVCAAIAQRVSSLTPELQQLTTLRDQLANSMRRPHTSDVRNALWRAFTQLNVARGLLADQVAAELEQGVEVAA
jgi:hypothetical protein